MFIRKLILGIVYNVTIFGVLLFIPAGTLHWRRAWLLLGLMSIGTTITMLTVFRGNEALLNERFKAPIQKEQPLADKIIVIGFITSFVAAIAFIPLDVFRFHLMGEPGAAVSSLGLALMVAGWTIITLALKENAFAAPVVKHQAERGQRVIDTGIYGIVRHPMYAGGAPFILGLALWLESYAGAVLAIVPIGVIALRSLFEEQFLRRELDGYEAYTTRVRYRMIPFVW